MKTITQYFSLQLSMFKRHLVEFGINPILGFVIILIAFFGFSLYLFAKTEFANYFYILMALSFVSQYSEINRNDFLKFIYPKQKYFQIRIFENLITIIPFIVFLFYNENFYSLLILIVGSILFSFLQTIKKVTPTIPTPFYRKPFEFIVGFRKSIIAFLFVYFIAAIAVVYHNFNLGIFSLVLVYLLCLTFYIEPEHKFYVWVHKLNANQFLLEKIATAFIFSTLLSLPITFALIIFFPTQVIPVLFCQLLGYCYLSTIIFAKYAAYPKKLNLPNSILVGLSFTMPPLLLVLIPFFYYQSLRRLKEILE